MNEVVVSDASFLVIRNKKEDARNYLKNADGAQILNRKSLILCWIKGKVTPQACNH
jgi:hypothetical protein